VNAHDLSTYMPPRAKFPSAQASRIPFFNEPDLSPGARPAARAAGTLVETSTSPLYYSSRPEHSDESQTNPPNRRPSVAHAFTEKDHQLLSLTLLE
jgi:hypothetical protein